MNVKTTFLNDDLEEMIYMTQPKGCVVDGQENKVWKLLKSLYGDFTDVLYIIVEGEPWDNGEVVVL